MDGRHPRGMTTDVKIGMMIRFISRGLPGTANLMRPLHTTAMSGVLSRNAILEVLSGGKAGIRTRGAETPAQALSRRSHSTTLPPPRGGGSQFTLFP